MSRRRRRAARTRGVTGPPAASLAAGGSLILSEPLDASSVSRGPGDWNPDPVIALPGLEAMTVANLRQLAVQSGVTLGKARTKAAIIEVLRS